MRPISVAAGGSGAVVKMRSSASQRIGSAAFGSFVGDQSRAILALSRVLYLRGARAGLFPLYYIHVCGRKNKETFDLMYAV